VIKELRQEKSESSHMTRMLVFMQVASHCWMYEVKEIIRTE